jgi:hypothetical protein
MQIPEEFYDFCLYLHQDSFDVYGTDPKGIAAGAMRHMSKAQKQTLAAFLDELLSGKYSNEQLDEIYRGTDAEIGFRSGLRYFLALAREATDRDE